MAAELKPRPAPGKTSRLKAMLNSSELEFILEAHNGVSARIVEEAGFQGIWASGLALSAQFGVRDNNEASWTQIVDMLEFMSDATSVPILLDGDTGYGNFNNLRRLVHKLEQRGVAGVCIEDKLFPKTNSFISGERQPLADIDEFSGKIAAGKDSQSDDDFCIVARVEALIAGWDVSEAIRRAEAYHAAGADAILIHSKLSRADEILAFADAWQNRAPVVIVPTKYYSTPVEVYRQAGISMVIWANHMIRSAVQAMQDTAARIARDQSLSNIEDGIARVKELFRLQGAEELALAEQRYLANRASSTRAIILAATRGSALQSLTQDRPKAMIPVNGRPLLRRMIDKFKRQGVNDVTVVGGYKAEAIQLAGIEVLVNAQHATTGELASLRCAADRLDHDAVICYGDLLMRSYILSDLLESDGEITVAVDSAVHDSHVSGTPDYAWCSRSDNPATWGQEVYLERVGDEERWNGQAPHGRWVGILRVTGAGTGWLREALAAIDPDSQLALPDLLNRLIEDGRRVRVLYIHGHWMDVNTLADLEQADTFTGAPG